MPALAKNLSKEEIVRLGKEIYWGSVHQGLSGDDTGKFLALDVVSSIYEVDEDDLLAINRLRKRCPSGEILLLRIGQEATCRLGADK